MYVKDAGIGSQFLPYQVKLRMHQPQVRHRQPIGGSQILLLVKLRMHQPQVRHRLHHRHRQPLQISQLGVMCSSATQKRSQQLIHHDPSSKKLKPLGVLKIFRSSPMKMKASEIRNPYQVNPCMHQRQQVRHPQPQPKNRQQRHMAHQLQQ
jgi:hypothetical protein